MERTHRTVPKLQKSLQSFRQHKRLAGIVRDMAREIERLDEENTQLRAAVSLYREAVRRFTLNRSA